MTISKEYFIGKILTIDQSILYVILTYPGSASEYSSCLNILSRKNERTKETNHDNIN